MSYLNYYHHTPEAFDANISAYFDAGSSMETFIDTCMRYSLEAGGKRLRPLLLLEFCTAYGGKDEDAYPFAMAIEMIHTYSLIHDDLPCMDDDKLRRGKPTNHVVYGEDMAVLAGDGLLNTAAELMAHAAMTSRNSERALMAMHTILKASGTRGMILGQVADIKMQCETTDVAALDYINHYKTGKLLTASMTAGALIGGAEAEEVEKIERIGHKVGLLFQVVDDLLDLTGDVQKMGKEVHIDSRNDKVTYPLLLGISETQHRIEQLRDEILAEITNLSIHMRFFEETIKFLTIRDH
ncbi:polyprenyl synthetase family protein [Fusibacter paucivorans]|uniref:Polyprenyl synthetase family protein n=1 Tax=Fusibacter paucivorans TaxID=76009 RepID=A0ABS5PQP4_9FIRM|nr:farnesyl diphosphate synthase [Fusibacter paucivorans]MBS7526701.1 polyprenyl synthetase family protein [Fusibacter paucivorans]